VIVFHDAGRWLTTYVAVLARVAAFVTAAPVIGQGSVPVRVRALWALALTVALAPIAPPAQFDVETAPLAVARGLVLEIAVGALLGLVARLVFDAVTLGAEAMSLSMGLGASSLFDPMLGEHGSVLAVLQGQVALALFLALDGHHHLLRVLGRSFETVPLLAPQLGPGVAMGVLHVVSTITSSGLALAAPVLVLVLLFQTGLAVVSRAVPTLGSFAGMGFVGTVAIGLLLVGQSLTHWLSTVGQLVLLTQQNLDAAFSALVPR